MSINDEGSINEEKNNNNNILSQPELTNDIIKPITELSINIAKYIGLYFIKEISKITGINLKNTNIANVLAEINKALNNPETQKQVKDLVKNLGQYIYIIIDELEEPFKTALNDFIDIGGEASSKIGKKLVLTLLDSAETMPILAEALGAVRAIDDVVIQIQTIIGVFIKYSSVLTTLASKGIDSIVNISKRISDLKNTIGTQIDTINSSTINSTNTSNNNSTGGDRLIIKKKTRSHKKSKKTLKKTLKSKKKSYKLVELKFYISLNGRISDINDFSQAPINFQNKTFLNLKEKINDFYLVFEKEEYPETNAKLVSISLIPIKNKTPYLSVKLKGTNIHKKFIEDLSYRISNYDDDGSYGIEIKGESYLVSILRYL